MFKIGLKLWSINQQYIPDAIMLFEQGMYDYIELFAVPGSLEKYGRMWRDLDIPYIIHAPHFSMNVCLSKAENFSENIRLVAEAFEYATILNAPHIIFHPGIGGDINETVRQLNFFNDKRILIENKPRYVPGLLQCIGYSPWEIAYLMKEARVGFCLDVGHALCAANALGVDKISFLKNFLMLNPTMLHLTDGEWLGMYDEHFHLGVGTFPLKDIIALCPKNKMITLETEKLHNDSLRDFIPDVTYLRNVVQEIKLEKEINT